MGKPLNLTIFKSHFLHESCRLPGDLSLAASPQRQPMSTGLQCTRLPVSLLDMCLESLFPSHPTMWTTQQKDIN
jgi:hypothetical protein